ncbi:MAG: transposase [Calditrichaeota bacterium]|nr:transposase [Calditrichota bacterium]
MGLRFTKQNLGSCFFITTTFYNHAKYGEISGVYEELADSINNRLEKTNAKLISYVFMPSHIHMILSIDGALLSGFMRDFKKFTSQKSLTHLKGQSSLWQDRYDRVAIVKHKVLLTKMNYIHNNPVKAGLVRKPEDWYWSSAADYYMEREGPLPVWKG